MHGCWDDVVKRETVTNVEQPNPWNSCVPNPESERETEGEEERERRETSEIGVKQSGLL